MSRLLKRFVNRPAEGLAILMLVAMLMLVLLQVVGRYVFQNPPPWTEEAARFCMIWCGLLGAGSALFHRADPKLTKGVTSPKALPALLLRAIRWLAISVFVLPWLIYGPGFVFRHYFRATEAMNWNSAAIVVIVPIAGLVLLVYAFAQFVGWEERSAEGGGAK